MALCTCIISESDIGFHLSLSSPRGTFSSSSGCYDFTLFLCSRLFAAFSLSESFLSSLFDVAEVSSDSVSEDAF